MTYVSAPALPAGVANPENASKALCQMAVPMVFLVWLES